MLQIKMFFEYQTSSLIYNYAYFFNVGIGRMNRQMTVNVY